MKYLISLPENTIDHFHEMALLPRKQFFCTADPIGKKVGSGGGTAWLLSEAWKESNSEDSFEQWVSLEPKILIHAGGQSRRLPSYADMGKLLIPIPVFRWERGQRLNQTLLDLQRPLFEKIQNAGDNKKYTLIASGDVFIRSELTITELPDADIICFGLSVEPSLASNHGVFVTKRNTPHSLEYMLQKPDRDILCNLTGDSLFFVDVGIWLLSEKAVRILMKKSGWIESKQSYSHSEPDFYDLYSDFGLAMGENPSSSDSEISTLSVSIQHITDGEFFHFGTSKEIISSSLGLQNIVKDPRQIWTKNIKPHPAIFVQNSKIDIDLTEDHGNLWIENSFIGNKWKISGDQLITGIPQNDWEVELPKGICIDIKPVSEGYVIRPFGIKDSFRGALHSPETKWMNQSFTEWLDNHKVTLDELGFTGCIDIFDSALFPIVSDLSYAMPMLQWMIDANYSDGRQIWLESRRLSAEEISSQVELMTLESQRRNLRNNNWYQLAENYEKSVFFQVDLDDASRVFVDNKINLPQKINEISDPVYGMHSAMFQARTSKRESRGYSEYKNKAFSTLQNNILQSFLSRKVLPEKNVYDDQIVWSRSPVRIDLAGGWTDTPPYSVLAGGCVVNVSLELNGQPPLQAFIRPYNKNQIILRSIDLGERVEVKYYHELKEYTSIGSPFAIPKAALCLAGFQPDFSLQYFPDLETQLKAFGGGLEISFLAAIPKGSGMGTSSILASTILGALSDFCSLGWDHYEICNRTLALEQLLTTGGGWQDQYGGVIPGIKLLQTQMGWDQTPEIRWLPDRLFTEPEYHSSMLLYYTGITRVAKNLLEEIVEGMFLNERDRLQVLKEMKAHTLDTHKSIQIGDYQLFGSKIRRSWQLNKRLDRDTTNSAIEAIIALIDDLCIGYKLPGAGGGGYLFIVAKDPNAARVVKKRLEENPPNRKARFVHMDLSDKGMQVSRS